MFVLHQLLPARQIALFVETGKKQLLISRTTTQTTKHIKPER